MRFNLDSELGLARFGIETKHETKPNLPNSADSGGTDFLLESTVPIATYEMAVVYKSTRCAYFICHDPMVFKVFHR